MSNATESRRREVDADLDAVALTPSLGQDLFGIVDAITESSALRRALSDPAAPEQARAGLANQLFGSRVSAEANTVLQSMVKHRWTSSTDLLDGLERQGVRAELKSADNAGQLDEVADELFRFSRTVAGDHELREAVSNQQAPLAVREALVTSLLADKAHPATLALALRALKQRERTYALTIGQYTQIASQIKDHSVAKVVVARPLDADQVDRLKRILKDTVGRPVDVQVSVDPSVLGGMRVQIGDEVIDGTVSHRLEDARRKIA